MHVDDKTRFLPAEIAARTVFSVEGISFSWADVIAAAAARGRWGEHLRVVRDGIVAEARAVAAGDAATEAELGAVTAAFRRGRNLIAGDDLLKWLGEWGLSVEDWEASLRRDFSRRRYGIELAAGEQLDQRGVDEAAWPDAVTSGFIERAAREICADAAVAMESGHPLRGLRSADLQHIQETADAVRAAAVNAEALEREVARHRSDWIVVSGQRVNLADEDVAREAAMAVRLDGSSLADIATACGTEAEPVDALLADIGEPLATDVLAAREGDLLGPVRSGNSWTLVRIERKDAPHLDNPLVADRARAHIIRTIEDRAISRYVTWHEPH